MILLDGKEVVPGYFSDGTFSIKEYVKRDFTPGRSAVLTWRFENNAETLALYYLTKHLRDHGVGEVHLRMPYVPNARKDRARPDEDVFTLKYFAELINGLHFNSVTVLDPHSTVSEALFDRLVVETPKALIEEAATRVGGSPLLFFPDEGAMKRYSVLTDRPYIYGMKKRDLKTREITELQILGQTDLVQGSPILMIDDICSSGKTLLRSAKQLSAMGAGKICVYVSHCENTVGQSELLTSDLIGKLYTTDSLLTYRGEKIEILHF